MSPVRRFQEEAAGEIAEAGHGAVEEEAEDGAHWQELQCLRYRILRRHHHQRDAVEEEVVEESKKKSPAKGGKKATQGRKKSVKSEEMED